MKRNEKLLDRIAGGLGDFDCVTKNHIFRSQLNREVDWINVEDRKRDERIEAAESSPMLARLNGVELNIITFLILD